MYNSVIRVGVIISYLLLIAFNKVTRYNYILLSQKNNYRIAGFYCEHKLLQMIYLGHRRNTCGFYIYEYIMWTKLFCAYGMHALVWCDISSSIAFIDVCFVYSGFYDLRKPCVQGYLGLTSW